jgi:hypothetical protein
MLMARVALCLLVSASSAQSAFPNTVYLYGTADTAVVLTGKQLSNPFALTTTADTSHVVFVHEHAKGQCRSANDAFDCNWWARTSPLA